MSFGTPFNKIYFPKLSNFLQSRFYLDLRSLALCRILIGSVLAVFVIILWLNFQTFFTDNGVASRTLAVGELKSRFLFSLFFLSELPLYSHFLMFMFFISAIALIIGYHARWAAIVCWYLFCCLEARNQAFWHAGDYYLRSILFWFFFLPIDAKFSVKKKLNFSGKNQIYSFATVVFILQILISYFFAGVSKLHFNWFQGNSLPAVLRSGMYASELGSSMSEYLIFKSPTLNISIILMEVGIVFFIFLKLPKNLNRFVMCSVYFFFHFLLFLFMNLDLFPFICISAISALLPPNFWKNSAVSVFQMPLHFAVKSILSFIIGLIILSCSLASSQFLKNDLAKYTRQSLDTIGHFQGWNLFTFNSNLFGDFWMLIEGTRADGKVIDVFRDGAKPLYEKPKYTGYSFKHFFWIKYFQKINNEYFSHWRKGFGRYLCIDWNSKHIDQEKIVSISVNSKARTLLGANLNVDRSLFVYKMDCKEIALQPPSKE